MTEVDRVYRQVRVAYLVAGALFLGVGLFALAAGFDVVFYVACFLLGVVTGTGRANLRRMRRRGDG